MKKPLIKSLMTKQKKLRSYRCPVAFHFSAKSVDCHLSVQFLSFLHPDDKQVVSLFSDTNCINAKKAVLSETNTYAAAFRKIYFDVRWMSHLSGAWWKKVTDDREADLFKERPFSQIFLAVKCCPSNTFQPG